MSKPTLYEYQKQSVNALLKDKHICLQGVGTGKTPVMMRWLYETKKKHIVIVTTASKARSGDMLNEALTWNGQEWLDKLKSFDVVSWHKFDKFSELLNLSQLDDYAFAFDEVQKSKGYSSGMGHAFLRVALRCPTWTGYTATPGDQWKDYISYFTACKLVKNKTEFQRKFCVIQTYRGFPEIIRYNDTDILESMWDDIVVAPDTSEMMKEMPLEDHKVIKFKAPRGYKKVLQDHAKLDGTFIESTPELCHYLRQICFTKEKQEWLADFIENLGTNCIFFCNYIEEEETVCNIAKKALPKGAKIWRIDGKHHDIPTAETIGKYDIVVAHYLSGGEALNLQFMHYWCSVSPHYSYSTSEQSRGRIRRIGQRHFMRFYYLWAEDTIEDDIYDCLKAKSTFNEKIWAVQKGLAKE